ncbi:MAG: helix-turn-helix domain-containing protein [Proteobacteria bacterium]|nr:MAG: helix-turn-helix domain-containing protein [Pseudomonadota bacterium]
MGQPRIAVLSGKCHINRTAEVSLSNPQGTPQSLRATAIDRHVGLRIRERRSMMGLSQQQLARIIGVTYQQAHKYERGLNRVSAGRLFEIAQALAVGPSWFFEGLPMQDEKAYTLAPRQRLSLELMRNFSLIRDEKHQDALSQMARSLAKQVAPEEAPEATGK